MVPSQFRNINAKRKLPTKHSLLILMNDASNLVTRVPTVTILL